jgi:hypothetical protein
MKELIEKIKVLIKAVEIEKGPIQICALFLRDNSLEKWDLVISATWLNPSEMQSYKIISSLLQENLSDAQLFQISHIVILNQDDPTVSYLQGLETIVNGGFKELRTDELTEKFKFSIKRAYLLRSQKL